MSNAVGRDASAARMTLLLPYTPLPFPLAAGTSRASYRMSVLYRKCRRLMREGEPIGQPVHRLFGGGTVERHQRGGAALDTGQIRTPAVLVHMHRLDEVGASADCLFEPMNRHDTVGSVTTWKDRILAGS